MKLIPAMLALIPVTIPALAQELNTDQCITTKLGEVVCVETRLFLKPDKPVEPPIEPPVVVPDPVPYADAGARLPIDYAVADLGGTPRYVAVTGSGTECTEAKPCPSIKNAHDKAANGDPIIVKGGTYTNVGNTLSGTTWGSEMFITKAGIQLYAAPGETVIFDGAINAIQNTWTTEGNYKWTAYVPRPCGNGFGITFCTESGADNVNGTDSVYPYNVGKYIDQVWVDGSKLQEVAKKTDLTDGRFFVDRTNNRVYLTKADRDAAQNEVAVCNRGDFITVHGADVDLAGFTVKRYCNSPAKAAMLDVGPDADRFSIHDVVMDDATIAFFMQGTSSNALEDASVEHITITDMNWMGINLMYNTGVVFDAVRITGMDPWDEYSSSPTSGAIKTSRISHSIVKNSHFGNNSGQGVWYDQSNFDADVFNNRFEGTGVPGESSMFFWEISHGLDFYNNVIVAPISTALKVAGSSGVRLLNNTITGGKDSLGIYADNRSTLDCAKKGTLAGTTTPCQGYSSDRWAATWEAAPDAMNWLTSVDVVEGNIFAYPVSAGLCGATVPVCINRINQQANLKLENMLPNGLKWDCNVYAVAGAGDLVRHHNPTSTAMIGYTSLIPWTNAMQQASPYPDELVDVTSLAGSQYVNQDGTPTEVLSLLHTSSPCAFPTDPMMNAVIPAGTKHYGVTYQ